MILNFWNLNKNTNKFLNIYKILVAFIFYVNTSATVKVLPPINIKSSEPAACLAA